MNRFLNARFRLWLYGIVMATLLVVTFYGIITKEGMAVWAALGAAICGIAIPNVTDAGKTNE